MTYAQLSEQFEALLRDLPLESRGGAQALGEFVTERKDSIVAALRVAAQMENLSFESRQQILKIIKSAS